MRDHDYDSEFEVECLSGCFMFFRCSVLAQLGGFDERFFCTWKISISPVAVAGSPATFISRVCKWSMSTRVAIALMEASLFVRAIDNELLLEMGLV